MSRYIVQSKMRPPVDKSRPYADRPQTWVNVAEADSYESMVERFYAQRRRIFFTRVVDTETGEVVLDAFTN